MCEFCERIGRVECNHNDDDCAYFNPEENATEPTDPHDSISYRRMT